MLREVLRAALLDGTDDGVLLLRLAPGLPLRPPGLGELQKSMTPWMAPEVILHEHRKKMGMQKPCGIIVLPDKNL